MASLAHVWEQQGIEKGLAKGIEKGKQEKALIIAKNLLKAGIEVDVIANSTGLSPKEIAKLREFGKENK